MPSLANPRVRATLWIVAGLVIVGSFGLWLRTSSLVRVTQVTVTGIEGRQAGAIRDALTLAARDMTTLNVDDGELLKAVSSYPVVRSVSASADFPHRLRIAVNAYEPVAALQVRGRSATAVSGDGRLLRGTPTKGLPVVVVKVAPRGDRVQDGPAAAAIRVLAAAPAPLRARMQRVYRTPRGIAATVRDGPRLYFGGADRLAAKWVSAALVLAEDSAQGATYVDVRIPERPVAGGFAPRPVQPSASTLG